ncbi:hypothetical protein RRG08_060503 [Elysia crispata]|uniref:Uncharacterized protein n=1 Tax=Elysia crispata TaxID=231223 RepID=A0AAE1E7F4_9GAST|nr:hypothetical protein RRG08_060503 [Elysia crispata]
MWKDQTIDLSLDSGRDVEGSHIGQRERFRTGCGKIIPWTKACIQDWMWKDHTMDLGLDLGLDMEGSYYGEREILGRDVEGLNHGLKLGFRTGC